jgi:hypothetical protein
MTARAIGRNRCEMTALEAAAILSLAALVVACSPARPLPAKPRAHAAPVLLTKPAAGDCPAASKLLNAIDARLHPERQRITQPLFAIVCVGEKIREAASLCPALSGRAAALARVAEDTERAGLSALAVSADGRWLAAADGQREYTRLWALTPTGPRLLFRGAIEGWWSLGPDSRLYGLEYEGKQGLFVFDPTTLRVHRFEDVTGFGFGPGWIVLQGKQSLRRLDAATLGVNATVALSKRLTDSNPSFLAGGRSIFAAGTLASFESQSVLREGLTLEAVAANGERFVSCDPNKKELEVVDATNGATIARFSTAGSVICEISTPTLTPDGSRVVGFDSLVDRRGMVSKMAVVVFDVESGKTRRSIDRKHGFGTAHGMRASVRGGADQRVCVDFGGMGWVEHECDWLLQKDGRVLLRPEPKEPLPRGVTGTELARAASSTRLAIVTFTDQTKNPDEPRGERLRVAVVDARDGALLKTIDLVSGSFRANPNFADPGDRRGSKPSLAFIGDSQLRVVFSGIYPENESGNGAHSMLVDIDTGSARDVEEERLPIPLGHGLAAIDNDLLDLRTGRRDHLPTTADHVLSVDGSCTTWK